MRHAKNKPQNVSGMCYDEIITEQGTTRDKVGGDCMSRFELQLLGLWDKTPEFEQEYELTFGEKYSYTTLG